MSLSFFHTDHLFRFVLACCLIGVFNGRLNAFQKESQALELMKLEIYDSNFTPDQIEGGIFQYVDGKVYYLRPYIQKIKVFDFQSGEEVSEISLTNFGPNAVGREVKTFYVLQPDSILVYSEFNKSRLSLINEQGDVYVNYNLRGSLAEPMYKMPVSLVSGLGAIARIGSLIITSHSSLDYDHLKTFPTLQSTRFSSRFSEVVEAAPKIYKDNLQRIPRLSPFLSSFLVDNSVTGEVIMGSPFDHNLHVSKDSLKSFISVPSKSSNIDEFRLLTQDITEMGIGEYNIQRSDVSLIGARYHTLLHDPYNKLYYRIVRLGLIEEEVEAVRNNEPVYITPSEYSVMVLDYSLQIVKEKKFSSAELNFHRGLFVAPDGLWVLSRSHTDSQFIGFFRLDLERN